MAECAVCGGFVSGADGISGGGGRDDLEGTLVGSMAGFGGMGKVL